MGKRSNFDRNPRDFYPTPYEAVTPLLPHLPKTFEFYEPCAGDGILVNHLTKHGGTCILQSDIEPQAKNIIKMDALSINYCDRMIITNPPWDRKILHCMIEYFTFHTDCWLLFDADWPYTKQSIKYIPHLAKIVSIGRLKWIPDSKMTGKDNCAWYYFTKEINTSIQFVGRT